MCHVYVCEPWDLPSAEVEGDIFFKNKNLKILGLLTAKHSAWLNIEHAVNISRFLTDI